MQKQMTRIPIQINPDTKRVIALPFAIDNEQRIQNIFELVNQMDEFEAEKNVALVQKKFEKRHRNFEEILQKHFSIAQAHYEFPEKLSKAKKQLIASYLTMEYAFQGAALFNPSIVPHPEQAKEKDSLRFLISLRATGEGHLSSITFRTGTIDKDQNITLDPTSRFATNTRNALDQKIDFSELVIFPQEKHESRGMEDLRLVQFINQDNSTRYYGTYTAYDGKNIHPMLLETKDFRNFQFHTLRGKCAQNKGMALFPKKIDQKYTMCSRNDGRNLYLMQSEDLYRWENAKKLAEPKYPWELSIIGNCGSPLLTSKGWLLITHGVGPMREYCIGAILLDQENPSQILKRLKTPLLFPNEQEREGYVPNVVYSCGSIIHKETLYIPYAMSDSSSSIAKIPLNELFDLLS